MLFLMQISRPEAFFDRLPTGLQKDSWDSTVLCNNFRTSCIQNSIGVASLWTCGVYAEVTKELLPDHTSVDDHRAPCHIKMCYKAEVRPGARGGGRIWGGAMGGGGSGI